MVCGTGISVDCASKGEKCEAGACKPLPPSPECSVSGGVPTCADEYVLRCVDRTIRYLSCTDIGASACDSSKGCVP